MTMKGRRVKRVNRNRRESRARTVAKGNTRALTCGLCILEASTNLDTEVRNTTLY